MLQSDDERSILIHRSEADKASEKCPRSLFLANAIAELTTIIIEKAPINDLFAMVLEAFYRSLDFTPMLFVMRASALTCRSLNC